MKKHIYEFLFGRTVSEISKKVPIVKIRPQFLEDNDEKFNEVRNKMKPFVKEIDNNSVSDYYEYHQFRLNTAARRKKIIEKTKAKKELDLQNNSQPLEVLEQKSLTGEQTNDDSDNHH